MNQFKEEYMLEKFLLNPQSRNLRRTES